MTMAEDKVVVAVEENENVEEITVIDKAYNVSEKGKISMLGSIRKELKEFTVSNLEEIDLSNYEVVDNKFLVKQIATCGTTKEPIYLKLEMVFTNVHPNDLSKKTKPTKNGKPHTYKRLTL